MKENLENMARRLQNDLTAMVEDASAAGEDFATTSIDTATGYVEASVDEYGTLEVYAVGDNGNHPNIERWLEAHINVEWQEAQACSVFEANGYTDEREFWLERI